MDRGQGAAGGRGRADDLATAGERAVDLDPHFQIDLPVEIEGQIAAGAALFGKALTMFQTVPQPSGTTVDSSFKLVRRRTTAMGRLSTRSISTA